MKNYTLPVKERDDGECYIEFNDDILTEVGWKEGDTLTWTDNKDGSWTLKKKDDVSNPPACSGT